MRREGEGPVGLGWCGGGGGSDGEVLKGLYRFIKCFTLANGTEHIYTPTPSSS